MSDSDIQKIIREIRQNRTDQESVHTKMQADMAAMKATLDVLLPMAAVYQQFTGFGAVLAWVFKWIVIPASVVIGIIISMKKLK